MPRSVFKQAELTVLPTNLSCLKKHPYIEKKDAS